MAKALVPGPAALAAFTPLMPFIPFMTPPPAETPEKVPAIIPLGFAPPVPIEEMGRVAVALARVGAG